MRRYMAVLIVSTAWLFSMSYAHAQEETERFIPIGQSPGLSGSLTDIGSIQGFDAGSRTLKLNASSGPQSVRVTERTRIWLDRSKVQLTNLAGSTSDLAAGRMAEVKYTDPARKTSADWIKVEVGN